MKKNLLFILVSLFLYCNFTAAQEVIEETTSAFVIVEKMPEFPGGKEGLSKYLSQNIIYPPKAAENGVFGKVYVSFIVTSEGSVTKVKVIRGVDPLLDAEAVRVVSKMPKWKPGEQDGKLVNVSYTLPLNFALTKSADEAPSKVNNGTTKQNPVVAPLKGNYVITTKQDTVYGPLTGYITVAYNNATIWVNAKTPKERSFELNELKSVRYNGSTYVVRPSNPDKKKSNKLQLMRIMFQDGTNTLIEKVVPAGYTAHVDNDKLTIITNSNMSYSKVDHYVFAGDQFVSDYNRKNFRKIIEKYFNSCPRFTREVAHNKELGFNEVENLFYRFCE